MAVAHTATSIAIIGGGPGGYGAALAASAQGLSVTLVERAKVGGTCLHRGCIPAKELLETAARFRGVRDADAFGVETSPATLSVARAMQRKDTVVDELHTGLAGLLKRRGIVVLEGSGELQGDGTVIVRHDGEETSVIADAVVLAPGSAPRQIPGFEPDGRLVVTSDEFFSLQEFPDHILVIGGGAIGVEFASMLADCGRNVTICETEPTVLAACDVDVAKTVTRSFKKRRISLKVATAVSNHVPHEDRRATTVHFSDATSGDFGLVVVAVGRQPVTTGLLSDDTTVVVNERGFIQTNGQLETAQPRVFAVGDVVAGSPQLAHVGFAEALIVVGALTGAPLPDLDGARVPWAIYSRPEVAFVGLTEAQAIAAGYHIVVKKDPVAANARARIIDETEGLVKIIAEADDQGRATTILGVHLVGPWATEQLGGGALAVNLGLEATSIAHFLQPHPSLSETYGETLLALGGRGIHAV